MNSDGWNFFERIKLRNANLERFLRIWKQQRYNFISKWREYVVIPDTFKAVEKIRVSGGSGGEGEAQRQYSQKAINLLQYKQLQLLHCRYIQQCTLLQNTWRIYDEG